jgi:c-di-GMP-binding flagellar brake protein YcgR
VSNALNVDDAPQPPKVLSTPLEISSSLRQLQESQDPLIITFHERSQRFQSYLVDLDRDGNMIALDEMIPREGERFLLAGEPFKLAQLVDVQLDGEKLKAPINGKLLDISATGCKLRFDGDITGSLQLGQVYNRFNAALPFGTMTAPVELRYLHFEERIATTFAGVRLHNMSGLVQRQVERFVYQLQREARRFDKDDI